MGLNNEDVKSVEQMDKEMDSTEGVDESKEVTDEVTDNTQTEKTSE